ncbi:gephyrin-like molybdotransferase Glp [Pseudalkalibacillus hwajinpoensis]|uniref:Molybdopterin molybdenumtransferase n=1 Tax=Guptibacillus hwajinpoensis TaxID=208199 RepID=A0A4U1MKC8_9BACL|nr:gephyrin-like molybdotransferase Glp [Pseudalkalibacillus hwajinpoensis]TKD71919.1 molybdopterin molybdotransferase MoeA [Pseudalkalibacillus hwajinpoensis]
MVERRKPIPVQEAIDKVMTLSYEGATEIIPLSECDGRHLSVDVRADHDVPPFDRSPYDGFAIRAEDTYKAGQDSPVTLEVIEEIGAGTVATKFPQANQAIRIMTGAPIPEGTNAVIMLELVQEFKEEAKDFIKIKRKITKGDNLSLQGEDTKKGTNLIEKGSIVTPGVKALLATFGYAQVPVAVKPEVGIFATGTELLDPEEALEPGKIRNSNSPMIEGQVKDAGANPLYFGKLDDDFETCFSSVKKALEKVDFLITTGGVSVGDYDYLPAIYEKLGATVLFNKVGMRPGSVTTVAEWNGKLLFGLSGNPSACFVGFELFARPILKRALFSQFPYRAKSMGTLLTDFPKPNPFTRFVRCRTEEREGRIFVKPTGLDKSGSVTSLAEANAFAVLPGGTRGFKAGDLVDLLHLRDAGSEYL